MNELGLAFGTIFGGVIGILSGVVIMGLVFFLLLAPYFALKRETDKKSANLDRADQDYFLHRY